MEEKRSREYRAKEAIGIQGLVCIVAYACRDYADNLHLALKPGEKQVYGECYFELFNTVGHRTIFL
ncbi:MAG: hypothetical protein WCF90_00855 [Methanomicrobiales archaeon]